MAVTSISASAAARPLPIAIAQPATRHITPLSWLLAINALILGASAIPAARLDFAGMLVHPINITVALVFLGVVWKRAGVIPERVVLALLTFFLLIVISALLEDRPLTPIMKLAASLVTLLVAAMTVTTEAGFRMAAMAMSIAVAIISARAAAGVRQDSLTSVNPMQGIANENAFSLYALPALLLSAHYALAGDKPRMQRLIFAGASVLMVLALFATANRSGWGCAVIVAGLLSVRAVRRTRTLLLLSAILGATIYLIVIYGNVRLIEANIMITEEGYASDQLRLELFKAGFEIGWAHPLLGVSPQRLPLELARMVPGFTRGVDAHNVFALILGGSGIPALLAMLWLASALWRRPRDWRLRPPTPGAREAHFLLRCMLVVWCARGMFGGEILHSPSFSLGLGMCIGLCICQGVWSRGHERPRRRLISMNLDTKPRAPLRPLPPLAR